MTQQEKKPRGLLVNIYHRPQSDCTNGGSSFHHNQAILIGEGLPELFAADGDQPVYQLVKRTICGNPYLHVQPIESVPSGRRGYMFGGNFVFTSDSRFPNKYPLPIHDRIES